MARPDRVCPGHEGDARDLGRHGGLWLYGGSERGGFKVRVSRSAPATPLERLRGLKRTKGGRDSRKTHETYRSDRAAAIFVVHPTCVNTLLNLKRGIINNEYRRLDRRTGTFRAFCEFEGLGWCILRDSVSLSSPFAAFGAQAHGNDACQMQFGGDSAG